MAAVYADRAFLSINGVKIQDIQTASLRQNFNAKPVDTMTPDNFNRGFVEGNTHIDVGFTLAIQKVFARPKVDQIDYKVNDIAITFECGADVWIATGMFKKDAADDASGVGAEAKFQFNMGATKLVDAVGNAAALFDITLAG